MSSGKEGYRFGGTGLHVLVVILVCAPTCGIAGGVSIGVGWRHVANPGGGFIDVVAAVGDAS
jgi:hypothetical protein